MFLSIFFAIPNTFFDKVLINFYIGVGVTKMEFKIDNATLLAAKTGNLAAFEKIVFTFERAIFSYVYRLVNHRQIAEDLTQETFIKIYQNIHNLNMESNIKSWIFTIATHVVYDFFRKKRIQPEPFALKDEENSELETFEANSSYYLADHKFHPLDIDFALNQIKPLYKNVLLLYYQQGLSYQEIADALSLPLGTVKTLIFRAKLALKNLLKNI